MNAPAPARDTPAGCRPRSRRRWPPELARATLAGTALGELLALSLAADTLAGRRAARLRRAPSAGGACSVEAHLVTADGVCAYDPVDHTAVYRAPGSAGTHVVLCSVPSRLAARYGPRSRPLLLLDAGHACAALATAARILGHSPVVRLLPAARLAAAACLPEPGHPGAPGVAPEVPLACVSLDGPEPGPGPGTGPAPEPDAVEHPEPGLPSALTALAASDEGVLALPADPVPPPWVLRNRRSPEPPLDRPVPIIALDAALAAARAVAEPAGLRIVPAPDAVRSVLPQWAAGQAFLTSAGAVLLVLSDGTGSRAEYLAAGAAVHLADLAARGQGAAGRPIGIRQRTEQGHVVHALALTGYPETVPPGHHHTTEGGAV